MFDSSNVLKSNFVESIPAVNDDILFNLAKIFLV